MGVFWLCRTADEGEYGCAAVQQRTNVFVISGWDAFLILFLIDDTVRTFKQLREGTTKTEEDKR